jgi:hypothetical protein
MKLKSFTLALVLFLLSIHGLLSDGALAQRASTNRDRVAGIDRWYVFVSPEGKFTLSFPQKPNQEADESGPITPVKSYGLYTHNGMRFSVNFQNTSGDPNSHLANEWSDRYEQELLSNDRDNKRRVVQTQRLGTNIFQVEIWESSSASNVSLNYLRQTILRNGRIYTLLCGSEIYSQRVNKSICRRFFTSMHFIADNRGRSR